RSGLPSAVRGVGPAGGQLGSPPRPGPAPRPRPPPAPRPSCAMSPLDVESPATIAAATAHVSIRTMNLIRTPVSGHSVYTVTDRPGLYGLAHCPPGQRLFSLQTIS